MSNDQTGNTIKVTLVRSWIGRPPIQEATARSLRLRKLGQTAEHPDTPVVRGMISKIQHLVRVEETGA
jgi:large subunit ribosomal protein L30